MIRQRWRGRERDARGETAPHDANDNAPARAARKNEPIMPGMPKQTHFAPRATAHWSYPPREHLRSRRAARSLEKTNPLCRPVKESKRFASRVTAHGSKAPRQHL